MPCGLSPSSGFGCSNKSEPSPVSKGQDSSLRSTCEDCPIYMFPQPYLGRHRTQMYINHVSNQHCITAWFAHVQTSRSAHTDCIKIQHITTAKLTGSYKTCNYMTGACTLNMPWTNIVKPNHFENFEFSWLNKANPATLIPSFETINVHPAVGCLQ